jgi:DNA-binding MarR family transcriptional regulator
MRDIEPLSKAFGQLFLRMHRLLDRRMAQSGASLSRTKMLMYVEKHGPSRGVDIAGYFGLAPRTVTEALDGLERDGLVRRDPDKADRRVKRVSITDEGRRAMTATEPLRLRLTETIFGVLDPQERAQLDAIVTKLAEAIDREEAR